MAWTFTTLKTAIQDYLETTETTSFKSFIFILNFNLIPYKFNNNKGVESV